MMAPHRGRVKQKRREAKVEAALEGDRETRRVVPIDGVVNSSLRGLGGLAGWLTRENADMSIQRS